MVKVSATEFKRKSGEYIERALKEEVVVQKRERPVAVVVDYETYRSMKERLEELEDRLWALLAERVMEDAQFVEVNPEQLKNV